VVNINLHTINVRNTDMTYSIIPTHKIMDVAFINWRGMLESESRRIKRALILDQSSIKLCDAEMLKRLSTLPLIEAFVQGLRDTDAVNQITNSAVFRVYVENYLKGRADIYQEGRTLMVRLLAPVPDGRPLEIIAFTRTTDWKTYEAIQAEIIEHLLVMLSSFYLRLNPQHNEFIFCHPPIRVPFERFLEICNGAAGIPQHQFGTPTPHPSLFKGRFKIKAK
jgi:miniconductance mechanosensitive channel